jgi:hypothetical protein
MKSEIRDGESMEAYMDRLEAEKRSKMTPGFVELIPDGLLDDEPEPPAPPARDSGEYQPREVVMSAYRIPGTKDLIVPATAQGPGGVMGGAYQLLRPGDAEYDVWLHYVMGELEEPAFDIARALYQARGLPSPV